MLELGQGCSNMDTVMRETEVGAIIDEYSGQHTLLFHQSEVFWDTMQELNAGARKHFVLANV